MARKKSKELDPQSQAVEMNLTPMIDCTFLLLTFFMIVSEMSSLDMESLSLPYADQAKPPEDPSAGGDRMITINIKKDDAKKGFVRIQGRNYDKEKLAELIRKEAIKSGREHDPSLPPSVKAYKLRVLIRCDRMAKYETVQWVFDACSKNGVYKTILAASPSTE